MMRKIWIVLGACALASSAFAVSTRTFVVTSYKDFDEGEATGVLLSSLGEALSGFGATRVEVNEPEVYSLATAPDGTVYAGTGDQGAIYSYSKGKTRKLCKLDAVLVSSLAIGPGGTLLAGTMPGGKLYSVDKNGVNKEIAKLDAEHIWALSYDEAKQTAYAATGPSGKLFAVDLRNLDKPFAGNRAKMIYDSGEKHLLSMARGSSGALYVGSADQAILFKVIPDASGAKVTALHDFEGEEVRAIAARGDTLYVAVNEFTRTSATITTPTNPTQPRGTKMTLPPTPTLTPPTLPGRDRKGKGAVWRVDPDGRVEQLHALADGYFTALHVDAEGNLFAASGTNGKVYLIKPDRTVYTAYDLPERQVLALALDGPEPVLATGDAGALYKLSKDPPKDANYLTKVLDAQFPSRWGNLRWAGSGALAVQTRSGNTSRPDKTWSSWQSPGKPEKLGDGGVAHVASPAARYLQVKVGFGGAKSSLRDLSVYYQPQNQRARLTEITVGDDGPKTRPTAAARSDKPRSPIVKLKWKVENPDDDQLVYRLWFREESEVNWKPLGGPEPLTRTDYEWNTEPIPDGHYVVKVVASDERSNPREDALEHSLTSSPFLVDNRKPELADVKIAGAWVSGRARDSFSPISELAYSIDGGDWQPFAPTDGIFDDPVEEFTIKLPDKLSSGAHSIAVRAVDAADNVGAVQISFRTK
jgi:sugar lactone lactonase YvrE